MNQKLALLSSVYTFVYDAENAIFSENEIEIAK